MTTENESLARVMLIAAHPDDPEFGCGGTIAKWADAGKEITYVLVTSGDKGSHDRDLRPDRLASLREEEQRAAARVLGVQRVIYLRHPDGLVENTIALRRELAGLIRQHKPHIIVAIDPWRHYQLHPDHRAAGQAAIDALWAAREWNIFPEQLADLADDEKPWRVSELYLFWTDNADYWEDISETVELRIEALACHESQVGTDRTRLEKRIRERAAKTGESAGYEYGEEFKRINF